MKKDLLAPLLAIFAIIDGELIIYSGNILPGLGIHLVSLLTIILIIIFGTLDIKTKNLLQSLTLIILLRIANISMPQLFALTLLQYSMVYGVMFIPIYLVVKNQHISSKELGVNFKRFYLYLPIAIVIGIIMAIIEYKILNPMPLIENINIANIILITIVMFVFIGSVEEIIFRPILQTRIEKVLGTSYGILLSGGLFGIMHASYGIIEEVAFATTFGIIMGYIFQKTRNLPFIITIHGMSNVTLFVVLSKNILII